MKSSILIAPVIAAGILFAGGTGIAAAAEAAEGETGGSVIVDAAEISVLKVSRVGGGTWDRGTTHGGGGVVYSNYHHPKKVHGSSVKNAKHKVVRSPNVKAGVWSHAQAKAYRGEVDRAYWRVIN